MKPQKPNNNIGKGIYKQITKLLNDLNLNLSHGAKVTLAELPFNPRSPPTLKTVT